MDSVFIYWDNSNIFHEAQRLAEERDEGPNARYRARIHFDSMLRLAHADRPMNGLSPPAPRRPKCGSFGTAWRASAWKQACSTKASRIRPTGFCSCRCFATRLDCLDCDSPGIAVFLTGDGAGYLQGAGFHRTLERMRKRGWRVEILSWAHSTNQRMRRWAEENGVFVALDDFYEAVTYMEPSRPGFELAMGRDRAPLDLSRRAMSPAG